MNQSTVQRGLVIEKCLNSILRQTYQNLEVIVVDDGSTDGTAGIIRGIAGRDHRIRLLCEENRGTSAARNYGLEEATGEYLTFVDSDDYIARDYVERLQKRCESTEADMVICGLCYVGENGRILKRIVPDYYQRGVRITTRGASMKSGHSGFQQPAPIFTGDRSGKSIMSDSRLESAVRICQLLFFSAQCAGRSRSFRLRDMHMFNMRIRRWENSAD